MDDWDIYKVGEGKYEAKRRSRGGGGGEGCSMVLAGLVLIPILLMLISKIPIVGPLIIEIVQAVFVFIVNCAKAIFIEFPIELIKIFFDSLPPIVRVIVIAVLVLPIIIYVILWIKRKIDKMN